MKSLLCPLLVLMLLPQIAAAYVPNTLGLFFDLEGQEPHKWIPAGSPGLMHLLLINPTATEGIAGWGCELYIEGCIMIHTWAVNGGEAINAATPPRFEIGLPDPLPVQPVVVLLTVGFFLPCNDCVWYEILGVDSTGEESGMAYFDSADLGTPIPMIPLVFGDPPLINCSIIPVEGETWAKVKAIYR